MLNSMINWIKPSLVILLIASVAITVACSPAAAKPAAANSAPGTTTTQPSAPAADTTSPASSGNASSTSASQSNASASGTAASTVGDVVVAGDITHGPMQPTVQAIKDVLAKYGDQVNVTWVDLSTQQGQAYFKAHGLSAHLNVIINGSYTYFVNGRNVKFQWFEGQGWTKKDLDTVLAGLINK
jgi:cytoskeletal protein RodZ